jgi:hypothetical protein
MIYADFLDKKGAVNGLSLSSQQVLTDAPRLDRTTERSSGEIGPSLR